MKADGSSSHVLSNQQYQPSPIPENPSSAQLRDGKWYGAVFLTSVGRNVMYAVVFIRINDINLLLCD